MAILNRFVQFLEWIEKGQDFIYFLSQPIGLSIVTALFLYFPLQLMGCDRLSATTFSSIAALTVFYAKERTSL